jgi:hypothetical protein
MSMVIIYIMSEDIFKMIFPCGLVAVKSIAIKEELVGKEEEEMVLFCTAVGGRPLPSISWLMPENVEFITEEESKTLVCNVIITAQNNCLILGR